MEFILTTLIIFNFKVVSIETTRVASLDECIQIGRAIQKVDDNDNSKEKIKYICTKVKKLSYKGSNF